MVGNNARDKANRAPPGILPDVRELKGKALFGSTDEAPRDGVAARLRRTAHELRIARLIGHPFPARRMRSPRAWRFVRVICATILLRLFVFSPRASLVGYSQ